MSLAGSLRRLLARRERSSLSARPHGSEGRGADESAPPLAPPTRVGAGHFSDLLRMVEGVNGQDVRELRIDAVRLGAARRSSVASPPRLPRSILETESRLIRRSGRRRDQL